MLKVHLFIPKCIHTYLNLFFSFHVFSALKDTVFMVTFKENLISITDKEIVRWDDVISDPGKNYDVMTGAYTAPFNGTYQFSVSKRNQAATSHILILVENARKFYCYNGKDVSQASSQTSCTFMVKLLAGQRVQVQNHLDRLLRIRENSGLNTWFMGHMLHPL